MTNNLKKQSINSKFILKSSCSQRFLKTHSKGLLKFYKTDVLKDHSKAALIKINSSIKIIIRLLCQKRYYQNYFLKKKKEKDVIEIFRSKENYQNCFFKKSIIKINPLKKDYQNYFLSKDIIKITLLKRNYQNYSTKKALSKPLP